LHDTNPGHRAASDWNSSAIGDVTAGDLERLDFALRAGRLGYWEFHPQTRQLISSGTYRENWGRVATEEFTYEQLLASIHPDERAAHELSVQKAVEEGGGLGRTAAPIGCG
jgi:hypothetical protein